MIERKRIRDQISAEEMLEYRREGFSNKEIAEMLDISTASVYNMIGGVRTYTKGKERERRMQEILGLQEQGMSEQEIAAEMKCSKAAIHSILKRSEAEVTYVAPDVETGTIKRGSRIKGYTHSVTMRGIYAKYIYEISDNRICVYSGNTLMLTLGGVNALRDFRDEVSEVLAELEKIQR